MGVREYELNAPHLIVNVQKVSSECITFNKSHEEQSFHHCITFIVLWRPVIKVLILNFQREASKI